MLTNTYLVDTNILVRLITGDDEEQTRAYKNAIEKVTPQLYVPTITIIETFWVLKSFYKLAKEQIIPALIRVINSEEVILEEPELIRQSLDRMTNINVSIVDVYLSLKAERLQAPVLTWNAADFRKLRCEFYSPDEL